MGGATRAAYDVLVASVYNSQRVNYCHSTSAIHLH